jgi:hypothetical protein
MTTKRHPPGILRPRPADFHDQFVRLGWNCVDHYRTSWRVVNRWLDEEGRSSLLKDHRAYRRMVALQDRFSRIASSARSQVITIDFANMITAHVLRQQANYQALRA